MSASARKPGCRRCRAGAADVAQPLLRQSLTRLRGGIGSAVRLEAGVVVLHRAASGRITGATDLVLVQPAQAIGGAVTGFAQRLYDDRRRVGVAGGGAAAELQAVSVVGVAVPSQPVDRAGGDR